MDALGVSSPPTACVGPPPFCGTSGIADVSDLCYLVGPRSSDVLFGTPLIISDNSPEVVPGLVEVEAAVPRLSPAVR